MHAIPESYYIHKATWPWASFKVQNGHTKVNDKLIWDFEGNNLPIKVQNDTMSYNMYKGQN